MKSLIYSLGGWIFLILTWIISNDNLKFFALLLFIMSFAEAYKEKVEE